MTQHLLNYLNRRDAIRKKYHGDVLNVEKPHRKVIVHSNVPIEMEELEESCNVTNEPIQTDPQLEEIIEITPVTDDVQVNLREMEIPTTISEVKNKKEFHALNLYLEDYQMIKRFVEDNKIPTIALAMHMIVCNCLMEADVNE